MACSGGHNCLMKGPPGAGKTLLARALPSILPPLSLTEALDITRIYSVADALPDGEPLVRTRPFRSPHHTISHAGLVGGGRWPQPGEISLAHRGVLFLNKKQNLYSAHEFFSQRAQDNQRWFLYL
ncbi:MAG: ATP-binding protein [Caldilineaceae bacterium]